MPSVRINGREQTFPEGGTILQALHQAGVLVPTLCSDERLAPIGGCRLCMVQLAGQLRPVAACTTPLADGMEIATHTDELEAHRRTLLKLLLVDYPLEAVTRWPEKEFHRYVSEYGLGNDTSAPAPDDTECLSSEPIDAPLRDDSHPYIHVDMSKCVTCFRCVRICDELQGQFVWQAWNRGDRTRIGLNTGTTLLESDCVSCGACVDTCPSGALEDKSILARGLPDAWTKTTCPYCGTGCEMRVGTARGRVVSARPELSAPVNRGHLCVKGRYAFEFAEAADRVTEPMLRTPGGAWRTVSWDVAIEHVAGEFRRIVREHGPGAIGVLGSARATNEENYLAQKFARMVVGTNNVDCCARVCHAPTAAALKAMLGTGAATNSFDDIEQARTILVAGSNATENHPIVGARIKQAALRGARLIVIDPRRIELAKYAACHLQLRPGTNVLLFNALAATIVEEGLVDVEFTRDRVAEFEAFTAFIRSYAPEQVADRCGVPAELIRTAARLYAIGKPSMCLHGLGMTEHTQGTDGVMSLVNLALLTGNMGRPGTGINPLRGQNNVQGSAQMGCEPASLTGFVSLAEHRARFEGHWGSSLPADRGLNLLQMMDAAQGGTFKGLWAIGYDVLLTNANADVTRAAMRQMDCVVVQDMFLNETAREFGTVFLPAASPFEKDGTFMNAERRIQRIRRVVAPAGNSKSDAEIICQVAHAMGAPHGFAFDSAEQIWDEVRQVWPVVAGISYARIEERGLQWPCPSEDHPGSQVLHTTTFPIGSRAALARIEYAATPEATSDEFPFLLVTGRSLYHFNAGTMTRRTPNVNIQPTDYVDIGPDDAAALGLVDGTPVLIRSRYGVATLPARVNADVRQGTAFCTFHDPSRFVNEVTSPYRDRVVSAPEYKVTAVQLAACRNVD